MCSFSEGYVERGIEKGIEKGLKALVSALKKIYSTFEDVLNAVRKEEEYKNVTEEQVRKYYENNIEKEKMSEMKLHAVPQPLLERITKLLEDRKISYELADKELVRNIKLEFGTRKDVDFRMKAAIRCDISDEEMKQIMENDCHDPKYWNEGTFTSNDAVAELKRRGQWQAGLE